MFVDELEVVNGCLATIGQSPLASLEDEHAYKHSALTRLASVSKDLQSIGWWFNDEHIWLLPDATSKYVYIPVDAIEIKSIEYCGLSIAQRGRRLYNTAHNTYEFGERVRMHLTRLLPFDDLPYKAAAAVRDAAILRFQSDIDGDVQRRQELALAARESLAQLSAEDVRQRKPNLLRRQSVDRLVRSYTSGGILFGQVPHPHITR